MVIAVGFSGHFLLNKVVEEAYETRKNSIEKKIGNLLNKKVDLGDYSGIRLFGISLTNLKIVEKENLDSKIEANNIFLGLMPIKSFLNQRWIFNIKPKSAKIKINKEFFKIKTSEINKREFKTNKAKFDLNFNLNKFTNIKLNDLGIESNIKGIISYRSNNKQVIGNLNANFEDKGNLKLKINSRLKQNLFSLQVFSNGIHLKDSNFNIFKRKFKISKGIIKSNFKISKSSNQTFCEGNFSLNKLKLNTSYLLEDINTDSLKFVCEENNLLAQTYKLNYGTLVSDLSAKIPLNQNINNIKLKGNIGYLDSLKPEINISGAIPYWFDMAGINFGNINAGFNLNRTELSNLNLFRSEDIRGFITASGELRGNINDPNIFINFNIDYPHYKGIRIREIWEGEINNKNKEYSINVRAKSSPIPSFLSLKFDNNFKLEDLIFSRIFNSNKGTLSIIKKNDKYIWAANNFPLDELELSLNNEEFDRVNGNINGSGFISFDKSNYNGRISWSLGKYRNIKFANSLFDFTFRDKSIYINSSLYPIDGGIIDILYDSTKNTIINVDFSNISTNWSLLTGIDVLKFNDTKIIPKGKSNVLDEISIKSEGKSFEEQMTIINDFLDLNLIQDEKLNLKNYLTKFDSRYDGNLNIKGSDKSNYKLNAKINAYLDVLNNFSNKRSKEDFTLEIAGGLFEGKGSLEINKLPLKTINIFLNQPKDFDGNLDLNLSYDLDTKSFATNISTNDASIKDYLINLEKGEIKFKESFFDLHLSLLLDDSVVPINFSGSIPINKEDNLELRIKGDEQLIDLIDIFNDDLFTFSKGNVNLRMLIKGSLKKPVLNGFLVIKDSEIDIYKNTIENINSVIIFDYDQIEIKNLNARRKDSGMISIKGSIPFYDKSNLKNKSISIVTNDFKVENNNINFAFDSNINVSGSLDNPLLRGEVAIKKGFINFNNKNTKNTINKKANKSVPQKNWPELYWERDKSIEVISNESILSPSLFKENLPKYLEKISFNNLKLKLGPEFKVQYSEIIKAYLDTKLDLEFNGKIGNDLNARGLINLSKGRANLYTTPFKLDKNKDNFILFASRNGIVPVINFFLISKVPDSIIPIRENNQDLNISSGLNADSSSSGLGSIGIGNTRLIKIEASYQGFLDQLSFEDENKKIQLRSTPSYSRSQIIGLIGGNSANLINRAFISQINGANAFSERFQLSLYPALIENNEPINNVFSNENLDVDDDQESSTNDVLASQAWVAEVGLDITDRINFAVQATPDRDDLPPLGILTLQANPNLELLGSMDSEGEWKSQVQLFFRY